MRPPQPNVSTDPRPISEVLDEFYRVNGYGRDGRRHDRWIKIELKPLPLSVYLPNFDARNRALLLHDVHHLATGYKTNLTGEAEIAAWEIGGSCTTYWAAWMFNFLAFCYGWICMPRRVFRAFVRGRHTQNLYGQVWQESNLTGTVRQMQQHLHLDRTPLRASVGDLAAYTVWVVLALMTIVVIAATVFGLGHLAIRLLA